MLAVFAVGNLAGPLLLGRLFDTVGRRPMISGTYSLSGLLLVITAILFESHSLSSTSIMVPSRSCSSSPRPASAPPI